MLGPGVTYAQSIGQARRRKSVDDAEIDAFADFPLRHCNFSFALIEDDSGRVAIRLARILATQNRDYETLWGVLTFW